MRMIRAILVVVGWTSLFAVVDLASAQSPARGPRIGYVYPAGGRVGTTVRITLGGQFLDGASDLIVSGGGVEAKVVEYSKPLNNMQLTKLREQIKELQDRKTAAQAAAKNAAQAAAKNAAKSAAGKNAAQAGKYAGKKGGKKAAREAARESARESAKAAAKAAAKEAKPAAKDGAKESAKDGAKDAAKLAAKDGSKESAKDAAKDGAKEKSSGDDAKPKTPPYWTDDDEKQLEELRRKLAGAVLRPLNPMLAEQVVLDLSIAADAKAGDREVRVKTSQGLTNPLLFCVGRLPERVEKDPAAKPPSSRPAAGKKAKAALSREDADSATEVELPVTVNGQILPGGVDRFRFTAKKGQRLVAIAQARRLMPYLADAVPGWFQATLALYDAQGHELAYADDFRFQPDPVLAYDIPADGRYVIEIKDAIYRGREDFVYRITLGELPLATTLYPLGGPVGEKTRVKVGGWNLPAASRTIEGTPKKVGIYPLPVGGEPWISQRLPFAADTLPECFEKEAGDASDAPQTVAAPIVVNGRIDRPNDVDVFRFEGRAGQTVVAEVYARRLNSPLDSAISLRDAAGRIIAANDDCEDRAFGLLTHHADSYIQAKLPADGAYTLHLTDAQHRGGPEYGYRVRISPPQPDFELRLIPSTINARAGTTLPIQVHVLRRDGYDGPIQLELVDPPQGFSLGGGRVPAGVNELRVTLTMPGVPERPIFDLRMVGRATIGGAERVQPVVPADNLMQAFAYHHLVPAQQWKVSVSGTNRDRSGGIGLVEKEPVKIRRGGTAKVRFNGGSWMADRAEWELSEPPEGFAVQQVTAVGRGLEVTLRADNVKSKGPTAGNLILVTYPKRDAASDKTKGKAAKKQTNVRGAPMSTLPAVPFVVEGSE